MKHHETQKQQRISLTGLSNWIKCYMLTDKELINLPYQLVEQLGGHLQERWISLNRGYYETSYTSSAPSSW